MTESTGDLTNWETYELVPPQIHVQRIRTQADLERALAQFEANNANNQGGFHYRRKGWRSGFEYATTANAVIKDGNIVAYTYHSEYGNSTSTREHHVLSIGDAIASNLHTRQAVLLTLPVGQDLEARDLPDDMLLPVLRRKADA